MTTQEQRIKLAEAMNLLDSFGLPMDRNGAFNPFEDANDDYAVLCFFRERARLDIDGWDIFKDYWREVTGEWNIWNYEVGDFARAALKSLP